MRTFELHRMIDETGVSGTGIVAQGIEFDDGTIACRWLTETASTTLFATLADLETVHGHDGKTRVVWLGYTLPRLPGPRPPMQMANPDTHPSIMMPGPPPATVAADG